MIRDLYRCLGCHVRVERPILDPGARLHTAVSTSNKVSCFALGAVRGVTVEGRVAIGVSDYLAHDG